MLRSNDDIVFQLLLCNFLAQTEALMKGKKVEQVEAELKKSGKSQDEIDKIKPHKVKHYPGVVKLEFTNLLKKVSKFKKRFPNVVTFRGPQDILRIARFFKDKFGGHQQKSLRTPDRNNLLKET